MEQKIIGLNNSKENVAVNGLTGRFMKSSLREDFKHWLGLGARVWSVAAAPGPAEPLRGAERSSCQPGFSSAV